MYDEVTSRFGPLNSPGGAKWLVMALVSKGILLAQEGNTLSEDEASGLLEHLVESDKLPNNTVCRPYSVQCQSWPSPGA